MAKDQYSVAELFKAYRAQKAMEEWHGEWGAALLYRPLAIAVSPILLRMSVGATTVTVLSLLLALCLPVAAIYGGYLAVGTMATAAAVLDCIDGTIARATGQTTPLGHYLDFLTDVVLRVALYAAIGLITEFRSDLPHALDLYALALAVLAALLAIVARLCRVYDEHRTGSGAYAKPVLMDRPARASVIGAAFSFLSGIDPLLPLIVLGMGSLRMLGWVVLWLLGYSALDLAFTQFAILRKL